jgi:23S rRNA (guanosine2251-2'-O)-methyltransferase
MGARIHGINPVIEALRAGRVSVLRVGGRNDPRLQHVVQLAERAGVPVRRVEPPELDAFAKGGVHQGVVADVRASREYSVEDLVSGAEGAPLLVVLDGIEDPHNVGAIVRSVDASGGHGVIRQTRRSASLDSAAVKASAGALMHVPVADVVNIARAIEELKELGVWTVGLAGDAPQSYDTPDLSLPTAIVLGAEGTGLRRLVRERCDLVVAIPMRGHVGSLNVSVAAGVMLFEAARQRRSARGGTRDR